MFYVLYRPFYSKMGGGYARPYKKMKWSKFKHYNTAVAFGQGFQPDIGYTEYLCKYSTPCCQNVASHGAEDAWILHQNGWPTSPFLSHQFRGNLVFSNPDVDWRMTSKNALQLLASELWIAVMFLYLPRPLRPEAPAFTSLLFCKSLHPSRQ